MLNHFLCSLDHDATAPADWAWPTELVLGAENPSQTRLRAELIGDSSVPREQRFLRALELTHWLHGSFLGRLVTAVDPRLSYQRSDVEARLGRGGTVVQYTGVASTPPTLHVLGAALAPRDFAFDVLIMMSNSAVSEPGSQPVITPLAWSGNITGVLDTPIQGVYLTLSGSAPSSQDAWTVHHRDPRVSCVSKALELATHENLISLATETSRAYAASPSRVHRALALVAALGGA